MPNYSYGNIMVRGYKNNVDEFVKIMQANYDYRTMEFSHKPHMYRIFECDCYKEEIEGGIKTAYLTTEQAWSAYVCMFDGLLTYYDDNKNRHQFATCVENEAKRLSLDVEIFAEEEGIGFQEHYIVDRFGNIEVDEREDMERHYFCDYDSVEEYNEEYNTDFTQEDWDYAMKNYNGIYTIDGIEDYDEFTIDQYKDICGVVIAKVKKD